MPDSAWRSVQLDRAEGSRRVRVHEDLQLTLPRYQGQLRQLAVRGLGRESPMLLISNDFDTPAKLLIQRYARRMGIEQRLAEWIWAFHIDCLSSAVPLNVDLDVVLPVLAGAACDAIRQRLPGYTKASPDTLQQRFLSTAGEITITAAQVIVQLGIRAYPPVVRQAKLPSVTVPWWDGRRLVLEQA